MRLRRSSGLLCLVFVAVIGASSPARAWTRTVVHSARATVEVERDATLYILLQLDVEVDAGWLHELELVDLGPGVELDRYRPPYFRSEEGEVFRPEAELHEDGRIRLSFPRREAPRRGEYRVFIRYRTNADVRGVEVEGEQHARVVWSVPAWETGLHNVSVEFSAPKGTVVPVQMQDTPPGQGFEVIERPDRTVVRWRRIHLPRLTAWPLALDAPEGSIVLPASVPAAPAPDGFRPLSRQEERPVAWALLALALLALLKRRSIEAKLGRQQLWVRTSWPVALTIAGSVVLVAQWLAPTYLAWGLPLILLAVHRPVRSGTSIETRTWYVVPGELLTASDAPDLLDATTPFGAAALIGCSASLFAIGQPTGALLLLPVFLSGARHHLPPSAAEAVASLRTFTSELRLPKDAPPMCFSWERASDGAPRLRVYLPNSRAGLLAASFVATSSAMDFGFLRRRSIMLLVQTRTQSDADDLMRRRTNGDAGLRDTDGSILRLVPWDDEAIELLRALAQKAPKPVKASRGTWLLREISEPGRKAAA
jgi:hypothetical protein